jgi:hypothetical protein
MHMNEEGLRYAFLVEIKDNMNCHEASMLFATISLRI